jgi:hypothetical protein
MADQPAQVLGDRDAPHTVTYLEDFPRALMTLGEREEALGKVWHVPNAERSPHDNSWRWCSPNWAVRRVFGRRPGGAWSW